jgi:phosphatidylglycerophosphate synthase
MTVANALTIGRVALVFVVIAVWARHRTVDNPWLDLAMVPLLATAIIMDALDGWAARKLNTDSKAGALFDIAGDRIVELALWTFFAIRRDENGQHVVPFWVPLVMITRTVLTDFVRSIAFEAGKTPFGSSSMQTSPWARVLVTSRWSRGAYGILKALCFCALGARLAWPHIPATPLGTAARVTVDVLVYATVVFSVLRGVPVLWDGRWYMSHKPDERK